MVNNEVSSVMFPGRPAPADGAEVPWANARYVDASYFPLLGIALRQGQLFGDDENAPGAPPRRVVVNETFVRRYLPGGNEHLRTGGNRRGDGAKRKRRRQRSCGCRAGR